MTRVCWAVVACLVFGIALQLSILSLVHNLQITAKPSDHDVEVSVRSDDRHVPTERVFHQLKWCPKRGFPNLNQTLLDFSEGTVDQAEDSVFGLTALGKARQATAQADSVIPNLIGKSDWFKTEGHGLLEENIYQLRVDVGSYTYMPGGHWRPRNCVPRWKVAIIIPFRNRCHHLPILLRHLVPMLQRQRLEFGVFTVNQENDLKFNRAMLMNIGFLESLNFTSWDCFVFHDVDHVPMNDRNYYGCSNMPRHLMSGSSMWNYTLLYKQLFGGVSGLSIRDMLATNGFSNQYWGWGGEDDDMYRRVRCASLQLAPRPKGADRHIGFYRAIKHQHQIAASEYLDRSELLDNVSKRMYRDGLSNLKYPPPRIEVHPLYTNISVDIFKL